MIILASASPARAKLLRDWGFTFQIRPTNTAEDHEKFTISNPKTLVETLALKKYQACPRQNSNEIILAADTIIFFDGHLIGKPIDRIHAKDIITTLAGHTHQVWTGVCINGTVFSEGASVTFKSMTDSHIEAFLDTNDWVGKAGAYQIQKSIKPYIDNIDGDINTIIGLPSKTRQLMFLHHQLS